MVCGFYCNFSPLCFVTVGKCESVNCELGCKPLSEYLTHGRMVMPSGHPESVAIFLPWSVEGQCVNNNAVWLPGSLDHNLSVQYTVCILIFARRWSASMRADARAAGHEVQVDTDLMGQTTDRIWRLLLPYPRTGSYITHTHPNTQTLLNSKSCTAWMMELFSSYTWRNRFGRFEHKRLLLSWIIFVCCLCTLRLISAPRCSRPVAPQFPILLSQHQYRA